MTCERKKKVAEGKGLLGKRKFQKGRGERVSSGDERKMIVKG